MPTFIYKAKKDNAETVVGEVVARDADDAIDQVGHLGLTPVSVHEKAGEGSVKGAQGRSVGLKEMYVFTRQLVGLLKSGVSILQALELLARQSRNRSFARVLLDVASGVRNGKSFSASLADHPRVFSELYVAMARAGEESGKLKELLGNMAGYYRKQDEVAMKIRTALAYPIFMLVVGIASVFFILTYVMPRIAVLFDGLNTALPWPTVMVMTLSKVAAKGWPVLFIVVLILAIFFRSVDQAQKFRRSLKRLLFRLPFANELAMKIDTERFSRTLSLLLDSGIPILQALEIAIPTLDNEVMKQALWACHSKVSGGMGFGEALQESEVVPDIFAQLITVGEESGELAGSLGDIADTYDQEVTEATKAITTLLEPAMILVIGLVIGFIVFAMLMPVFQMDVFAR